MKRIHIVCAACATLALSIPACSSSSPAPAGTTDDSGAADQGAPDAYVVSPNNCVQPGATGNEKGIGAYCTPGQGIGDSGNECPSIDGGILVCSGSFGAPNNEVFCTTPCNTTQDCGSNAVCVANPLGTGCAPIQCIPADASFDSPTGDAPAGDAAGDAAAD
jgi:hypothetical protein